MLSLKSMSHGLCVPSVLYGLALLNLLATITSASFLPSDFRCWFQHGSVVVGDWLYVNGGEIWAESLVNGVDWTNDTISFDLRTSWNVSEVSPIRSSQQNLGRQWTSRIPTLWYNPVAKAVYRYGGWAYKTGRNTGAAVYAFSPNQTGSVNWTNKYTAGIGQASEQSKTFSNFTEVGLAAYAATPSAYFSLGGILTSTSDPALVDLKTQMAVGGLVSYDFKSTNWTNSSTVGIPNFPSGLYARGQSVYVPIFGKEGILVFLGGDAPATPDREIASDLVLMTNITIFDIASGKFYPQLATGSDIPIERVDFCLSGVGSPDNSTWEIFIYGGKQTGDFNQGIDPYIIPELGSVYILTLPAFKWVRATPPAKTSRQAHRCEVIGNRQMISLGGLIENNSSLTDPWPNGLGIFDMSELAWKDTYKADADPYKRSSIVDTIYQNGSNKYPYRWGDDTLQPIFNVPFSRRINTTSTFATTPTTIPPKNGTANLGASPSATLSTSPSQSAASTATIQMDRRTVGVALGGAAGLFLLVTVATGLLWKYSCKGHRIILEILKRLKLLSSPPSIPPSSVCSDSDYADTKHIPQQEMCGSNPELEMDAGMLAEMSEQHGSSELENDIARPRRDRRRPQLTIRTMQPVELPTE
ncbi:hypothetical protein BJ875DRAFT_500766 [Amylocarpus encephaloides]|uniref:Kelch repeat protein n=1 Tax=Amylocarpus encephaloides TaxID=45428 RepID=A0A9P7Y7Q3_9HELO|nr:hypothetical protein BJ875DRAFT_500766 [Amylocarpus encephaloides]